MSVFGPYPATVVSVHDGDTATLAVNIGFGVTVTYPCRIWGINAPELNEQAGKDARDYADTLLHPGDAVSVLSHGWDKYAPRFDGQITLPDGRDFGTLMIQSGHAVAYP